MSQHIDTEILAYSLHIWRHQTLWGSTILQKRRVFYRKKTKEM